MSFVGTWDGWRKGCPNQGEITLGIDGRWNWGTTDPLTLGNVGLGSLTFTANPFGTYTPTFLVRNLFWRQGSREAGWMYRIGRVTPDAFLNTSRHINPLSTFLPIAGTGAFAMGLPDSGLGMFAGMFVNDCVNVAGVVSDANADRFDFGDIDEGDLFTAVELQVKILPLTENAGYSKVTFWHNDGTKFGNAINGSTGKEGWGVFIKHEQELTCDGRAIAIARWGRSYKDSALYEQQAAASFVLYDPFVRADSKEWASMRISRVWLTTGCSRLELIVTNPTSSCFTGFHCFRKWTPRLATRRLSILRWTPATIMARRSASDSGRRGKPDDGRDRLDTSPAERPQRQHLSR